MRRSFGHGRRRAWPSTHPLRLKKSQASTFADIKSALLCYGHCCNTTALGLLSPAHPSFRSAYHASSRSLSPQDERAPNGLGSGAARSASLIHRADRGYFRAWTARVIGPDTPESLRTRGASYPCSPPSHGGYEDGSAGGLERARMHDGEDAALSGTCVLGDESSLARICRPSGSRRDSPVPRDRLRPHNPALDACANSHRGIIAVLAASACALHSVLVLLPLLPPLSLILTLSADPHAPRKFFLRTLSTIVLALTASGGLSSNAMLH
ncbi:hypothetical protein B0H15DRAFT_947826 [Mycena belliarum]|uniref:Uncharacterized protein n=1 Tax=Mycena belliarum TaxID=1033014 RepID=A0AAD6U5Z2_9AGAR|nr:hypothetical protein B0H15DRAFT_947826 [Mycena belliae]